MLMSSLDVLAGVWGGLDAVCRGLVKGEIKIETYMQQNQRVMRTNIENCKQK